MGLSKHENIRAEKTVDGKAGLGYLDVGFKELNHGWSTSITKL